MKQNVYIVGAGGFGREMFFWTSSDPQFQEKYQVKGFIDDDLDALKNFDISIPVVSSISSFVGQKSDLLLMAIAHPQTKLKVAQTFKEKKLEFLNYIHFTSFVGPTVQVGEGLVVCPFVAIPCDSILGDFITINTQCTVGHDTRLGNGCTLSGHCDVTGGVKIGNQVFLGSRSTLVPEISIGDEVYIGAGSVVIQNLKPNTRVFSAPAKKF